MPARVSCKQAASFITVFGCTVCFDSCNLLLQDQTSVGDGSDAVLSSSSRLYPDPAGYWPALVRYLLCKLRVRPICSVQFSSPGSSLCFSDSLGFSVTLR